MLLRGLKLGVISYESTLKSKTLRYLFEIKLMIRLAKD